MTNDLARSLRQRARVLRKPTASRFWPRQADPHTADLLEAAASALEGALETLAHCSEQQEAAAARYSGLDERLASVTGQLESVISQIRALS